MNARAVADGLARRLWPRVQAFGTLRLLLVVIALAAFAYLWFRARGRFPEATVWQVPLVLMLLLVSLPWRVVSTRTVASFFVLGAGPVFAATVISQAILVASPLNPALIRLSSTFAQSGIGLLGNVHSTIYAPITEEVWKVVPLLVALAWGRSRLWTQGGPLDFAILAAATGAGMGLTEDLLVMGTLGWSVPESPLLGLGVGTAYVVLLVNPLNAFPVAVTDFEIGYQSLVSILNPSVRGDPVDGAAWAGHGVASLAVGLALGWAALTRRRSAPRIVFLAPAIVFLWAVWHHFVANWYPVARCGGADEATLCTLAHVDLNGAIFPIAAIGMWVAGTIVSRRAVARYAAADPARRMTRAALTTVAYRGTGATWPLRFARDLLRFTRVRNRVAFAWPGVVSSTDAKRAERVDQIVTPWLEATALAARLRGTEGPPLGAPVQEAEPA